jgi:acetyl-CoA carboxylase carboxyl transferase subunit alpha
MGYTLPFEKPVSDLENQIDELKADAEGRAMDLSPQLEGLEHQAEALRDAIFKNLSPWERTLISRHPERPYFLDFVEALFTDWTELHGDRLYKDDPAIIGGLARFQGAPILAIGHQKGRTTKEKLHRNFGMPRPEGYRKALRLMRLAERFGRPIFCFIDTPGAYPGIGAEERGQAVAIADSILQMSELRVPVIAVIIGEGGSGGALAVAVANRVLMMENAIYSVISPEACASILWRDGTMGKEASEALRYGSLDCLDLGVADEVIPEPAGGAHRGAAIAVEAVGGALQRHLAELAALSADEISEDRYRRFRRLGRFEEKATAAP